MNTGVVVERGERVGLLGPNGAGKTTTLLMLLGATTPDSGTIRIDGYKLPRQRSKAMTKVGFAAGYLPMPLVLDEPTASLDPDIALRVRTALLSYCESTGAALLVTSHDMREVEMLTEGVMFLARGEVLANDTPAIVASTYGHDNLEDVFLSPAETHGR